ncbi:MAG: hypothetical protein K5770_03980 [Lachnospiraceae bacterium]|nr:hypothetical protein [Lachnospiraceae bacterium]
MARKQFMDEIWNAGLSVAKNNGCYDSRMDIWDAFKAFLIFSKVVVENRRFYGSEKLDFEPSVSTVNSFKARLGAHYRLLAAAWFDGVARWVRTFSSPTAPRRHKTAPVAAAYPDLKSLKN